MSACSILASALCVWGCSGEVAGQGGDTGLGTGMAVGMGTSVADSSAGDMLQGGVASPTAGGASVGTEGVAQAGAANQAGTAVALAGSGGAGAVATGGTDSGQGDVFGGDPGGSAEGGSGTTNGLAGATGAGMDSTMDPDPMQGFGGADGSGGSAAGGSAPDDSAAGGSEVGGSAATDPVMTEPDVMQDPVECTGEPPPAVPADMLSTIERTWQEMDGQLEGQTGARSARSSVSGRTSLALDLVMAGDGALTYCVRYNSSEPVTLAQRDKVQGALQRGVNAWFSKLVGYDCFPYAEIDVQVVGWAVANRATLEWDDDGVVDVFVNNGGNGGPSCDMDYDLDLRMTEGLGFTGYGEEWGQEVDRADYLSNVDGLFHIWVHEFGHTFGFPDYYDWDVWGGGLDEPNSVMVAGRAITVTDWDTWMLRYYYTQINERWQ